MERNILRTNGTSKIETVGDGYETWNEAIGAGIGQLVISPDGTIELWCDEEGLFVSEPKVNVAASLLVRQQIVGDVIVFYPGDVK